MTVAADQRFPDRAFRIGAAGGISAVCCGAATPGSYDPDPATGFSEVFAARLSSDGSAVQWATAFGGVDWDQGFDAALDGAGDVHIAGTTESRDFPTTAGAFDRVCNTVPDEWSCTNHLDAFALELSADGSRLLASTFVGGAGYEDGLGMAVDAAGRSYVAGGSSAPYGFPLVDAFQATMNDTHAWCAARADCSDAFLVRLDAAGAQPARTAPTPSSCGSTPPRRPSSTAPSTGAARRTWQRA